MTAALQRAEDIRSSGAVGFSIRELFRHLIEILGKFLPRQVRMADEPGDN